MHKTPSITGLNAGFTTFSITAHNLMAFSTTINKLRHSKIALITECFYAKFWKKFLMLSVVMLYSVMFKVVMLSIVYDER